MKRGSLFIFIILSLVFFILISFVSAVACFPPGIYNSSTHFCNVAGETEELKEDYVECLNNYECEGNSCVYGKKTLCVNTSVGIDCSDWNNDEFGCGGETDCEWYVSAQDEYYCEAEYAAVKERGNFLQVFLQRIINFFTRVFTRAPSTEPVLGAVSFPIGLAAVYDEDLSQTNLSWNKVSILRHVSGGGGGAQVIKSFPTEKITGQIIGSEGITGASVSSYSKNSCVGKTRCAERHVSMNKCNAMGVYSYLRNICEWDHTLQKCFPKQSCHQFIMAAGINKDTCETGGKDCNWITNTIEREYEAGMEEGGEVLVIFENSRERGEECYTRRKHVVVCNYRTCGGHNDVGIKCDEATAEAYCKAFGFEGYVANSKKCDEQTEGDNDHERWASNPSSPEDGCFDSPGRAKWILTMKCIEPMKRAACRGTPYECTEISSQACPTALGCEVGTDDTAVIACETEKEETCIPACDTGFTSCDDACGNTCDDSDCQAACETECEEDYISCIEDCDYYYGECVKEEAKSCQEGADFATTGGDCGVFSYRSECERYGCEWVTEVTTPQGDFTATEIGELSFKFDATSIGDFYSYIWSLGNTNIGSDKIITHNFTLSGTYVVKLSVIDRAGNEYELTKSIIVSPPICGSGKVKGNEECDDGNENKVSGDGCSYPACQLEQGWVCPVEGEDCARETQVINATNYTIYRSNFSSAGYLIAGMPLSESGYVKIAEIPHDVWCTGDVCNWIDDTISFEEGFSYYYIVTAISDTGIEGGYSDEASATVPDKTLPTIRFETTGTTPGTVAGQSHDQTYIEANVSAFDNYRIRSIIIRLYDEIGTLHDSSDMSKSSPFYYKFGEGSPLTNGVYYLNATVWDTWGLKGNTTTLRINISLEDHENPTIEFISPTTEEGEIYENSIKAKVNATDDRGIKLITIYLYNSVGLHDSQTSTTSPFYFEFANLPTDETYYLNASVTDIAGKISITETRNITVKEVPFGESYPTVAFVPPIPTGTYFPDSDDLVVEINITDNLGDLSWTLSSNVSGYMDGETTTLSHIEKTIPLTGLLVSVNNIDVHEIKLEATDSIGLTSSESFIITIKNEDCTDTEDNDGDGIYDGLDRDCATEPGAVALEIINISAPSDEVFTHRKINVNCEYETDSLDTKSIGACIKLTLEDEGISCKSKTVDTDSNTTKFRDCDVGSKGITDAKIRCFVNDDCNREGTTEDISLIDITKFSICDGEEDVGVGNLDLNLIEPGKGDGFDPEDDNEIDIKLEVDNLAGEDLSIIAEAWLYDVDEENKLGEIVSEAVTIDGPGEETFELMITVPDVNFSETNRLYYKAYVEGDEDEICSSDSISLELQEADCDDDDEDGYCEENDCDDDDEDMNPGVNESLYCTDNVDNDCDDLIDEDDSDDCVIPDDQIGTIGTGDSDDAGALTTRGVRRIMHRASILNFKIEGVSHSALVKTITSSSVTLTISSTPLDVSLATGQTKDVDSDRDGTEDLMITLKGIVDGAADITFRSIYTAPPSRDADDDADDDRDDDGEGIGFGWIIFIFILIIGIAVIVALIFLRKKREAGSKPAGVGMRRPFTSSRPPPRPPPRQAPMRRPVAPPRYMPPR